MQPENQETNNDTRQSQLGGRGKKKTRESESDAIGTGVGAATGGAAGAAATGAAAGAAAGPVGMAAGAAAGAVVGGLAGHAIADDTDSTDSGYGYDNLDRFVGYDVVDANSDRIGELDCIWSDDSGRPEFIGVKTGWIFGKTHVVPAQQVHVNEARQRIRLPYSESQVRNAPTFAADSDLSDAQEDEVYTYYGVASRRGARAETGGAVDTPRSSDRESLKLSEEELRVGKREVEVGGVRLRKIVRTEIVNRPVELKREDVVIERVPAGDATPGAEAFSDDEIYVPLRQEEAVLEKHARVREEVRARKDVETRQENVSAEVRREDVEIERSGDARVRGSKGRDPQSP